MSCLRVHACLCVRTALKIAKPLEAETESAERTVSKLSRLHPRECMQIWYFYITVKGRGKRCSIAREGLIRCAGYYTSVEP